MTVRPNTGVQANVRVGEIYDRPEYPPLEPMADAAAP